MDYNNKQIPTNTITRNLADLAAPTGNIYETTMIIAKRANQFGAELMVELKEILDEFASHADSSLEETFENREQIEISKYYEKLPKPTLVATQEFIENDLVVRKAVERNEECSEE